MTKEKNIKAAKKQQAAFLTLTQANYILFGVAVLVLIAGYVALSQGPADNPVSLTVAPLLLIVGYCILVPLSIFWRPKKRGAQQ